MTERRLDFVTFSGYNRDIGIDISKTRGHMNQPDQSEQLDPIQLSIQPGERMTIVTRHTILVCRVLTIRPNNQIEVDSGTSRTYSRTEDNRPRSGGADKEGSKAEPIRITG